MITLYGIRNCDTIRKARGWLAGYGVDYRFHDYKLDGVDAAMLAGWVDRLGWERLLNRAGTTFRKLPEVERGDLDMGGALALMQAYPSAIRRPVLVDGETLLVGFDAQAYADALSPAQEKR